MSDFDPVLDVNSKLVQNSTDFADTQFLFDSENQDHYSNPAIYRRCKCISLHSSPLIPPWIGPWPLYCPRDENGTPLGVAFPVANEYESASVTNCIFKIHRLKPFYKYPQLDYRSFPERFPKIDNKTGQNDGNNGNNGDDGDEGNDDDDDDDDDEDFNNDYQDWLVFLEQFKPEKGEEGGETSTDLNDQDEDDEDDNGDYEDEEGVEGEETFDKAVQIITMGQMSMFGKDIFGFQNEVNFFNNSQMNDEDDLSDKLNGKQCYPYPDDIITPTVSNLDFFNHQFDTKLVKLMENSRSNGQNLATNDITTTTPTTTDINPHKKGHSPQSHSFYTANHFKRFRLTNSHEFPSTLTSNRHESNITPGSDISKPEQNEQVQIKLHQLLSHISDESQNSPSNPSQIVPPSRSSLQPTIWPTITKKRTLIETNLPLFQEEIPFLPTKPRERLKKKAVIVHHTVKDAQKGCQTTAIVPPAQPSTAPAKLGNKVEYDDDGIEVNVITVVRRGPKKVNVQKDIAP
jgi:hypothetical protein